MTHMPSKKYTTPILLRRVYHIFNRGINHQKVFIDSQDKRVFLQKFRHYLGDFADVFSYCLLDNHYHFLLRIEDPGSLDSNFSKQFGKLILSYTHYFNKKYKHSGPIFHRRFKRLLISDENYAKNLIWYIHYNPERHGTCLNFSNYDFSSFKAYLLQSADPLIEESSSQEFFNSRIDLLQFHYFQQQEVDIGSYIME